MDIIDKAFKEMNRNLAYDHYDRVSKETAAAIEKEINSFRKNLRKENIMNLGKKDYPVQSAMTYNNVFTSLERIGDHIINVSESIVGEI